MNILWKKIAKTCFNVVDIFYIAYSLNQILNQPNMICGIAYFTLIKRRNILSPSHMLSLQWNLDKLKKKYTRLLAVWYSVWHFGVCLFNIGKLCLNFISLTWKINPFLRYKIPFQLKSYFYLIVMMMKIPISRVVVVIQLLWSFAMIKAPWVVSK